MSSTAGDAGATTRPGSRYWRLLKRFAAASAAATVSGQLVFVTCYALGVSALVSTCLAWLTGAVLNFGLNRRTWGSRGRSALRGELLRFAMISVSTAVLAALATRYAEAVAVEAFTESRSAQVAVVWGAFLGTYLLMFVVKFFLMDRLVFTAHRSRGRSG